MTAAEPAPPPEGIRCSDAEREDAVAALRTAVGEGRLSLAEVEERTETIYAARFRHELVAVVADLPSAAVAVPASGWGPVLVLAAQQFATDVAVLTGAGGATGAAGCSSSRPRSSRSPRCSCSPSTASPTAARTTTSAAPSATTERPSVS